MMVAMADFSIAQNLGALPYAGGFQEQPHSVTLYFRILNSAYSEANEQEVEAAKNQTK